MHLSYLHTRVFCSTVLTRTERIGSSSCGFSIDLFLQKIVSKNIINETNGSWTYLIVVSSILECAVFCFCRWIDFQGMVLLKGTGTECSIRIIRNRCGNVFRRGVEFCRAWFV